jgi:hypothetical protein
MNVRSALSLVAALSAVSVGALGCGGDEQPYTPRPAVSGKKAVLPPCDLPTKVKQGDAYDLGRTDLHTRVHAEVSAEKIRSSAHRQDQPRLGPEVRDPQDRQG